MVMRYPAVSQPHAAAGRFVPCALAHFSPPACGRAMDRFGARRMPRDHRLQMAGRAIGAGVLCLSPVPPSRGDRPGAFGGALEARGAHSFSQWGYSGSAENLWKSGCGRAKCLIPQANPSTSCHGFSTGCPRFSTGRISDGCRAAPSFSLSKSLKEKRKEQGESEAGRAQSHPRVEGVFPRVSTPAYFLIHGFHGSKRANLWKSVERKPFGISGLSLRRCASTDPQVALPVLPPWDRKRGRS